MLGELVGDLVGDLILKPVMELISYGTGRQIVRLFSLGRWDARINVRPRRGKSWKLLTTARNGRRYVDENVVSLIGLLGWAGVILAAAELYQALS